MDDTIKHMLIVLVFPTTSVFKHHNKCSTQHTLRSMGSYSRGAHATPQRAHALRLFQVYHSVGSSWLWVSLLNKCETSNSYFPAMTRCGIKPCWKISNYFQFPVKTFFLYFQHIISPSKRTTWCRFFTVGTIETVLGIWLNTAEVY